MKKPSLKSKNSSSAAGGRRRMRLSMMQSHDVACCRGSSDDFSLPASSSLTLGDNIVGDDDNDDDARRRAEYVTHDMAAAVGLAAGGGLIKSAPTTHASASPNVPTTTTVTTTAAISPTKRTTRFDLEKELFTFNKLRFDDLGLYGRDEEIQIIQNCYLRQQARIRTSQGRNEEEEEVGDYYHYDGDDMAVNKNIGSSAVGRSPPTSSGDDDAALNTSPTTSTTITPTITATKDNNRNEPPKGNSNKNKKNSKRKQIVFVSGYSGTGKSKLVEYSFKRIGTLKKRKQHQDRKHDAKQEAASTAEEDADAQDDDEEEEEEEEDPILVDCGLFYVDGKFDYYLRDKPFSGIISACGEICRQLLSYKKKFNDNKKKKKTNNTCSRRLGPDEDVVDEYREGKDCGSAGTSFDRRLALTKEKLIEQIGSTELNEIIRFFPHLQRILREDDDEDDQGKTDNPTTTTSSTTMTEVTTIEAGKHDNDVGINDDDGSASLKPLSSYVVSMELKYKFIYAFRVFIKVVCDYFATLGPIVLVFDDLQWADASSLEMIENLVHDQSNPDLMVVGIYRSNEVTETHLLSRLIRELSDMRNQELHQVSVTHLQLGDLDVKAIHHMVQDLLSIYDDDDDDDGYHGFHNSGRPGNVHDEEGSTTVYVSVGEHTIHTKSNSKTYQLAEICHKKTNGNPFYMIHFMTMLEEQNLLQYNLGLMKWRWDIPAIELYTKSTDNVVDLLRHKINNNLSKTTSAALQLAALFGSSFDESILQLVWKALWEKNLHHDDSHAESNVVKNDDDDEKDEDGIDYNGVDPIEVLGECLAECEAHGFIESLGTSIDGSSRQMTRRHRWVHDNIQEAALSLIPIKKQNKHLKRQVGEIMLSELTPDQLESAIFVVANLLNRDHEESSLSQDEADGIDEKKLLKLVNVNLNACKQAVQYSAFESASNYATKGIRLVSEKDWWSTNYDLCLELYTLAAEVEGCLSNVERLESYCNLVLERTTDRPINDKVRVYQVLIDSIGNREQDEDRGVQLCLEVLKQCNCTFPRNPISKLLRVLFNVIKIKMTIKNRTRVEVETLPILEDSLRIEMMKILDKLGTLCYISGNDLMPLVVFRSLHYTFKYGISEISPSAFGSTAIILCGVLGDLKPSAIYSNYSLHLLEKFGSKNVESRTLLLVYFFSLSWVNPARTCLKPLLRAYQAGMQTGDSESAMWSINFYIVVSFYSGIPLATIEEDCRVYSLQMKDLKREKAHGSTLCTLQMAHNLIGKSENSTVLTGQAMDEEAYYAISKKNKFNLALLNVHRLLIHSYFGDYEYCAEYAMSAGDSLKETIPGSPFCALDAFHRGLGLFAMARKTKCRKYKKEAKKTVTQFKRWVEAGNPNATHHLSLLQAEMDASNGRNNLAKKKYEISVIIAARGGFLHDAGIASERYGRFLHSEIYSDKSDLEEATFRLNEACKYYREWGAHAKVRRLQEEFALVWPPEEGAVSST